MEEVVLSLVRSSRRLVATLRAVAALGVLVVAGSVVAGSLHAQSPFNTDVLPSDRAHLRLDTQSHLAPKSAGGWAWTQPSLSYGLGHGVEVGAGLSIVAPRPFGNASSDITLSAKWAVLADSASSVRLVTGALGYLPYQSQRDGVRIPLMVFNYVSASARVIPSLREASPQVTLTGFLVSGPRVGPFNARKGVAVGAEQVLPLALARPLGADALVLQLNWTSARTTFSYASASLIALFGDLNVSVGYARGNPSEQNHGPSLGIGYMF